MGADTSGSAIVRDALRGHAAIRSHPAFLRTLIIAVGIWWSVLFVTIGLRYKLQMYADGSIFSYSLAVQDAWAFHWHNISGRSFVYLFCYLPAETYIGLTGDASGGIAVYGFLFFAAQIFGLTVTLAADRSEGRIIFSYACLSTACLCPLVFGFPTEMWMAHALFWPALAMSHSSRGGIGGNALVFAILLALVFTHEGALILGVVILVTPLFRGVRGAAFLGAAGSFLAIMSIWCAVKATYPPDGYTADALARAALNLFDVTILTSDLVLLLLGAVASYCIVLLAVRRLTPAKAPFFAALIVAAALAAYWLWFDHSLHTDNRYYLRTVLLVATPALGVGAVVQALRADGRLNRALPFLPCQTAALTGGLIGHATAGAILLVMLVHVVETAKFVTAWTDYKAAVQALATGRASDPALGDLHFVSSDRIANNLTRLSWSSTTHFLSVLVAPRFEPARLVVDPNANYFWLSCETATANEQADRVLPIESRRLVRVHACLHR
jgi:hypothetical protein